MFHSGQVIKGRGREEEEERGAQKNFEVPRPQRSL